MKNKSRDVVWSSGKVIRMGTLLHSRCIGLSLSSFLFRPKLFSHYRNELILSEYRKNKAYASLRCSLSSDKRTKGECFGKRGNSDPSSHQEGATRQAVQVTRRALDHLHHLLIILIASNR